MSKRRGTWRQWANLSCEPFPCLVETHLGRGNEFQQPVHRLKYCLARSLVIPIGFLQAPKSFGQFVEMLSVPGNVGESLSSAINGSLEKWERSKVTIFYWVNSESVCFVFRRPLLGQFNFSLPLANERNKILSDLLIGLFDSFVVSAAFVPPACEEGNKTSNGCQRSQDN